MGSLQGTFLLAAPPSRMGNPSCVHGANCSGICGLRINLKILAGIVYLLPYSALWLNYRYTCARCTYRNSSENKKREERGLAVQEPKLPNVEFWYSTFGTIVSIPWDERWAHGHTVRPSILQSLLDVPELVPEVSGQAILVLKASPRGVHTAGVTHAQLVAT